MSRVSVVLVIHFSLTVPTIIIIIQTRELSIIVISIVIDGSSSDSEGLWGLVGLYNDAVEHGLDLLMSAHSFEVLVLGMQQTITGSLGGKPSQGSCQTHYLS